MAHAIRPSLEANRDAPFGAFEPLLVATQVVAGMNYFFKILVDAEERKCIHVRVYRDLHGNTNVHSVLDNKTVDDALMYF